VTSPNSFYERAFGVIVAALLGYALLRIFTPFLGPLTWAAFLAFLLNPLNVRLRKRLRGNATAAAIVMTILTPIVILLPLTAVSIQFVAQASALVQGLQGAALKFDIRGIADFGQFPWIAGASHWLTMHFSVNAAQIHAWIVSGSQELLQRAASLSGTVFLGTINTLVGFMLMLFLLFFFLRDGQLLVIRSRRLIPLDESRKEKLIGHLADVTRAIVFGTTVTAFLQGLMLGIGFAIAGLPSPVVFGVLAALLAMLPVGGTALVWLPAAIWLGAQTHWGLGVFMLDVGVGHHAVGA
jgi:predicted PurR-regulated permease PerM